MKKWITTLFIFSALLFHLNNFIVSADEITPGEKTHIPSWCIANPDDKRCDKNVSFDLFSIIIYNKIEITFILTLALLILISSIAMHKIKINKSVISQKKLNQIPKK